MKYIDGHLNKVPGKYTEHALSMMTGVARRKTLLPAVLEVILTKQQVSFGELYAIFEEDLLRLSQSSNNMSRLKKIVKNLEKCPDGLIKTDKSEICALKTIDEGFGVFCKAIADRGGNNPIW